MEEYLHMVKVTAPIIRKTDPEAKIVSVTACGPTLYGLPRLASMLENGLGEYVDIHSFHTYMKQPETYRRDFHDACSSLFRKYAPHMELWREEAGLASKNPKGGKGALSHVKTSETIQARWLSRHITRDLADPALTLTSYFHFYDFEHFSHKYTYHYGLLRDGSRTRKPSFFCATISEISPG